MNEFSIVEVGKHLSLFGPPDNFVNVLLDDLAISRREGLSTHFSVVIRLRYGGFYSFF